MTRELLLVLLLGTSATACAPKSKSGAESPIPFEPTSLVVDNQDFKEYRIYIENDSGTRVRLGEALGNRISEFRIPESYARAGALVKFLAIPLASPDTPQTQSLSLRPGEQIHIRITP